MIILSIRTDRPEAEVGIHKDGQQLAYKIWQADRRLTKTLHQEIQTILNKSSYRWEDIGGVVVFQGPGSFTGLRIGMSVANALAYANHISVLSSGGKNWIENGIKKLNAGAKNNVALPKYGRPANITKPRK